MTSVHNIHTGGGVGEKTNVKSDAARDLLGDRGLKGRVFDSEKKL